MHRAAGLTLLAVVACVGACSDSEPVLLTSVASNERLTRFDFSIDGVGYAISLPGAGRHAPATRSAQHDVRGAQGPAPAEDHGAQPARRKAPIRISTGSTSRATIAAASCATRGSRVVRYRALGKTGEGSGGSIEEIAGRIDIGTRVLYFRCTDQGESSIRRDWCLDYIELAADHPAAFIR